jgi:hypothetical protein
LKANEPSISSGMTDRTSAPLFGTPLRLMRILFHQMGRFRRQVNATGLPIHKVVARELFRHGFFSCKNK